MPGHFFVLLIFSLTLIMCGPAHAIQTRKAVEKAAEKAAAQKAAAHQAAKKAGIKSEAEAPDKRETILPEAFPDFRARPEAAAYEQLCGELYVTKQNDLTFGTMERRLVCGDDSGGSIGHPWSDIPPNQKAYFLKGFLQTRGYHHPEFFQDGGRLYLKLGSLSRFKNLVLLGGPEGWQPPKRRLLIGEPLTPALLNDAQSWALTQIKDEGYACAEDSIQGDPDSGEVAVFYQSGARKRIRKLELMGDTGVNEGALNRYNAFVLNDFYKERMIGLTRRRSLEDGFLQTLVMSTRCGPGDEVTVVRDVSLGPPRTVRVGVGGGSDQGPLMKALVRQTRIGHSASSAQAQLNASYLNEKLNYQSLKGNFKWYYLHGENRYSLTPQIEFKHEALDIHDLRSVTIDLLHGWTFDTTEGHYDLRAGPGFISEDQERSNADHVIQAGYIEAGGRWTDHDFEWFNTSPRTGEYIDVTGLFALQRLGSNFTAQKIQVSGEKLWTIGAFDPPLFILGTRFNFSTVFSPSDSVQTLPTRFLTFLGGDADLRGYSLESLPRSGIGALTGANASVEGRLHDVLFRIVDVFTFLDVGLLGSQANARFDQPIFWSPGFGFRWESPVGVLRTYIARRFATEQNDSVEPYDKAFRLAVTFGQEF
jgi:outer membrane translocation and assembly module TamA